MEMTWELESLYPSFGSEKYQEDQTRATGLAQDLKEWTAQHLEEGSRGRVEALRTLEIYLTRYDAYRSIYLCLFSYAELRFSINGSDNEAMNAMDELEQVEAVAEQAHNIFGKWLAELENLESLAAESAYVRGQLFYLQRLRQQSTHRLGQEAETAITLMQITGSKAWGRLYMRTISGLRQDIAVGGNTRSVGLSDLQNLAYDSDMAVRKKAYALEQEACASVAELSAACINGVCGEAIAIYGLRGYASPLDKVLEASRMERGTLEAMMTAIREELPAFHRYYRTKARLLGHSGALPFHDVYAPLEGEASALISYSTAKDIIVSGFQRFSGELGRFAERAFQGRWIDAEPRADKGGFGMCVDIFPIGESRIMTSFNGHYIDVSVLAHELGHAYHSSCLIGQPMVNTDYPVPLAETASIFCESLIQQELLELAPKGSSLALLERALSDAGYYIVDFYARYLFESRLYERRQLGALSVQELNSLMHEAMVEVYGNGVDTASIHPYPWISKAGYYMAGNEFLNFPYSFGLLFSKGLYAQYKKQGGDFVQRYRTFLEASGRTTVAEAARLMGVELDSPAFWREAMALLAEEIEAFANEA